MTQIDLPNWYPSFRGGAWRAITGVVEDGRMWDTEEECVAYIDGLRQGYKDGYRRSLLNEVRGPRPLPPDAGAVIRPPDPISGEYREFSPNPDVKFQSTAHAFATGLIAAALHGNEGLVGVGLRDQPLITVKVGRRRYAVIVEELQ